MRFTWILFFMAATTMVAHGALSDIIADLKPLQQFFGSQQDVILGLNLTNIGNDIMGILNVFQEASQLMDPIVDVFCNGQRVKYVGAIAKRRAPLFEDFLTLLPGSSITLPIKISDVFNMTQACNYVAQLQMNAGQFLANLGIKAKGYDGPMLVENKIISTSPVALFADAHQNKIIEDSIKIAQGRYLTPTYRSCTTAESNIILSSFGQAERYSLNAVNYFNANSAATPRYTSWFGAYSATNWGKAKTNFNNIHNVIVGKSVTFDCSCKTAGTFAYVYPSQPYFVYFCGAFWSAPEAGTDSKGGTIIHEIAHFTVVAATGDYAYGQSAARALASSNPTNALANSDNHEYFVENNPAQS